MKRKITPNENQLIFRGTLLMRDPSLCAYAQDDNGHAENREG